MADDREREREQREGTAPDEAVREAAKPDPEGAGEAIAEGIRSPDYRTKTRAPSTSEQRLRKDELPDASEDTEG
jgi:hypothetical protein